MKDIQRQRTPELRAAVQAVLAGDPGEAVALLGSSVHEVAHEELGESAARAWLALDPRDPRQHLAGRAHPCVEGGDQPDRPGRTGG